MWYRIELNKDRSVRTCVEVSGSLNEGRSIHYIEADSKESAIAILAASYEKARSRNRRTSAKYAEAKKAKGECTVCRKNKEPHRADNSVCQKCADKDAQRKLELKEGAAPKYHKRAKSLSDKAAAQERILEATRAARRKRTRELRAAGTSLHAIRQCHTQAQVYREALEAFETMTPSRFRGWLVAKIAECQEKIDGKKSIAEHFPQAAE